MAILVSACILGVNCKYNGRSNRNDKVISYLQDKEVIAVCPEMLAGLPSPRPCAELVRGKITNELGQDVDAVFKQGVTRAMAQVKGQSVELAVLQSRSPTCGVKTIYDGTFSGRLINGTGLFAAELQKAGYKVMDVADFEKMLEEKTGRKKPLKACCGYDCSECAVYKATVNRDDKKPEQEPLPKCTGCQAEGVKLPYCQNECEIRRCALKRKVENCGRCRKFHNCALIEALFKNNPAARDNFESEEKVRKR